jgi:hypothetical protein
MSQELFVQPIKGRAFFVTSIMIYIKMILDCNWLISVQLRLRLHLYRIAFRSGMKSTYPTQFSEAERNNISAPFQ